MVTESKSGDSVETQIARIEERLSAHRKTDAVHHQHFDSQLREIKKMLLLHFNNEEADRLQIMSVIQELKKMQEAHSSDFGSLKDDVGEMDEELDELRGDFKAYKRKMIYWEAFHEWKRVPFWTFVSLFVIVSRRELFVLFDIIVRKFTGH